MLLSMDKSIEKAIYILQSKFLSYKSQRRFDKARFGELAHAICGRPRTPALANKVLGIIVEGLL